MQYDKITEELSRKFPSYHVDWRDSADQDCTIIRVFGVTFEDEDEVYNSIFKISDGAGVSVAPIVFDAEDTRDYYPEIHALLEGREILKAVKSLRHSLIQETMDLERETSTPSLIPSSLYLFDIACSLEVNTEKVSEQSSRIHPSAGGREILKGVSSFSRDDHYSDDYLQREYEAGSVNPDNTLAVDNSNCHNWLNAA